MSQSLYSLAADTALALTVRYLERPHRLKDARMFAAGRLNLWQDWKSLPAADALRIAKFLRLRPDGIAEDPNLLRWATISLDEGARFRWKDPSGRKGIEAEFERNEGKPLDRLIDELLESLEKRHRSQQVADVEQTEIEIRLRHKRHHFRIPAGHLPQAKTTWPTIRESESAECVFERDRLLSLATDLDAKAAASSIRYVEVLGTSLFPELRVRAGTESFGSSLPIPAGPTNLFVAPTGRGKSVLARVVALDLASRGLPVTLAVPDIKATLQEAHLLADAASRLEKPLKIVPLNSPSSSVKTLQDVLAQPPGHDPQGQWTLAHLGYFCRLAAYSEGEAPVPGEEPCSSLRQVRADSKEREVACPFAAECPKFDAFRSAAEADIIVVNHKALLQGRSPIPLKVNGKVVPKLPVLELVMKRSALVLIDEIDELQESAIARCKGDLQLSSSERLSPVHEVYNEFEQRRASHELPPDANLDRVRRPLMLVRWLAEELAGAINRGDVEWSKRDRLRWSRAKDPWLSRHLFGDEENAEDRLVAIYGEAKIEDDPHAEALRLAVRAWVTTRLDDPPDAVGLKTAIFSVLEKWPRKFHRDSNTRFPVRNRVIDGLIVRAILDRLERALNHLRVQLAILDEYGLESAARLREHLLGYRFWTPSPFGPLGRRATGFAFAHREDDRGMLSARAIAGDPHGFIAGLGNEVALALAGVRRPVLGLSATARFSGAPTSDVQCEVLVSQPDHGSGVKVQALELIDVAGDGKPLRVSGVPILKGRLDRASRLASLLWQQVLKQHLASLAGNPSTKDRARALLVTGSYSEATAVAAAISQAMDSASEVRRRIRLVVRKPKSSDSVPSIAPREIESFGRTEADLLIAPLSIVARGHNILQPGTDKSAIASIFVLVRPVPPADEIGRVLAHVTYDALRRPPSTSRMGDVVDAERRRAEHQLRFLEQSAGPFGSLPADLRHNVLCDVLVEMAQLAGRARRGGTDVTLYLADAAFHDAHVSWRGLLNQTFDVWRRDGVLDEMISLHGPFLRALAEFAGIEVASR